MIVSNSAARDGIVDYMRRQLIGPCDGTAEELREAPSQRYLMGMLYPQRAEADDVFESDIIDDGAGQIGDEEGDDPIALSAQHMPSSVGLSFVVTGDATIATSVSAARYVRSDGRHVRSPIGTGAEVVRSTAMDPGTLTRRSVLDGSAELVELWRPFKDDWIVTLALVNTASTTNNQVNTEDVLCQVALECIPEAGAFLPYPTADRAPRDPEDEEQALLYRHLPTYAVGHGCAASWDDAHGDHVDWVRVEFMPTEIIPGITFDIDGFDDVLSLRRLTELETDRDAVGARLSEFLYAYRSWIADAVSQVDAPQRLTGAVERLRARLEHAADRIAEGIALLTATGVAGDRARSAFTLANRAMLMQMRHSRGDRGGTRRALSESIDPTTDYDADFEARWRPFQLAFILLSLPSSVDPAHSDRDVVDLIWFPTGGGKTEAYLGLVAFQVFHRRLEHGDDGAGTTVITRYTLRLLTTQQFQRASTLTCAMELLRRLDAAHLGSTSITIGIWVGAGTTPNTFADAVELLDDLQKGERPAKGFQIEVCPWCGTEVVPESPTSSACWGVVAANDAFTMHCPNPKCAFHESLPISVVDEDLYKHPPTFLIATIDKFARLAWDERSGVFLGAGAAHGPSLIIQDELHLISGPLGTVAAIYEAAFDIVMQRASGRPKVVASTATIRRAPEQVRGLFDRDVFLFPPAGMSAEDSFFIRVDRESAGRQYVGVMAQSHTPTTATVHTMATLLQAPLDLGLADTELDAYWTLVEYHNSLRELGRSVTLARDDVPARISVIAERTDRMRSLESDDDLIELTSNIPSQQIPKNLEILGREHGATPAVSVVACTNMISVGVDVPRLGLMLVLGQPKSTSEYIQATSRVGRVPSRPPGLVVTLYSAAKPRDRSHYETFTSYHRAIYREVEPTSVTPWALPARERALHAALVILVRNVLGLGANTDAGRFRASPKVTELVDAIVTRVEAVDRREAPDTRAHLERLIAEWENRALVASNHGAQVGNSQGGLRYQASGKEVPALLQTFTADGPGWPTLNSMRNVDHETLIKVDGEQQQ